MPRRFDPVHLGSPRFRTREHGPFLVTDAWFPPGLRLPPHDHERTVIAVTLDGGWDSVMLRRPYECIPGTLLVEPAGERHSNHFGKVGGRVLILQPAASVGEGITPVARWLDAPRAFTCPAAGPLAQRLRDEIRAPDSLTALAIDALSLELIVAAGRALARTDRTAPAWLSTVIDYLHAHAREPLTLARAAAVAGVHPAHLARVFRRHHRSSIAAYVRALRLGWAADRLARSDQPIAQIAVEAGFADQSHFSRAFQRHAGRTPAVFRGARAPTAS